MGWSAVPKSSFLVEDESRLMTVAGPKRELACPRWARIGALFEVEMELIDELREERVTSEIIDSGEDQETVDGATDGYLVELERCGNAAPASRSEVIRQSIFKLA